MLEPVEHGDRATLADLTGSRLGRFTIGERLGQGGMGEVYRAEDSVLRRSVAIKRITPSLSSNDQYRTRFLKEAERASSLSNPYIAVVHDVLEDHGSMFLVMEYVEGRTLRQRMQSPLTLEEFYEMAEQCAKGLAAAHQNGILHCDIKPENIMVDSRGQVKILDFGLAKQLPRETDATLNDSASTNTGSFSGTLAYMSPEVLLETLPDARSDLFSLGVVFYEVLAKRHPFRVESFIGTSDRILREEPAPIDAGIPAGLECLVLKMLSKDPAGRPATAEEVLRELEAVRRGASAASSHRWRAWRRKIKQHPKRFSWTVATVAVVVFISTAIAFQDKLPSLARTRPAVLSPMPESRQLAVLPFRASEVDGGTRAYSLGLTEILTTRLAELSSGMPLQVVSSGDIRSQAIATADQARTHYGANLVLEGTLSRAGTMMRVHYTLVDPENQRILRAGMIAGDAGDPFGLEDRVVESVLKSLELELTKRSESATLAARTQQPEAYEYFLRGRGYLQEYDRPENIDHAIQEFQRSLIRDPEYALAYAGLGESYRHKYEITSDASWMTRGQEACRKASQLAPKLPDGHVCLGIISTHTGKYEDAVAEFQKALAIDARDDRAQVELALVLERLGKFQEAETTYKNAVSMRPQYWSPHNRLGRFYLARGRYAEAVKKFEQVVALAPDSFRGYSNLGAVFLMTGRYAEAIPRLERSVAIRPNAAASNNLGAAYFYMRRYEEAARAYEKAVELDSKDYAIVGNVAEAYYWAPNQREKAIQNYRKALAMAKKSLETNPNHELTLRALALYSAMLEDRASAIEYDAKARAIAGPQGKDPESSLSSAIVHAKLGDRAATFRYLEEAVRRGLALERITQSPNFDHLRDDPRMKALKSRHS